MTDALDLDDIQAGALHERPSPYVGTYVLLRVNDPQEGREGRIKLRKVAEEAANYAAMDPVQLAKKLTQLENQMYKHAQSLEFEEAARLRDEIQRVKAAGLIA